MEIIICPDGDEVARVAAETVAQVCWRVGPDVVLGDGRPTNRLARPARQAQALPAAAGLRQNCPGYLSRVCLSFNSMR